MECWRCFTIKAFLITGLNQHVGCSSCTGTAILCCCWQETLCGKMLPSNVVLASDGTQLEKILALFQVVFQPYRPLVQYCQDMQVIFTPSILNTSFNISELEKLLRGIYFLSCWCVIRELNFQLPWFQMSLKSNHSVIVSAIAVLKTFLFRVYGTG